LARPKGQHDYGRARLTRHALERFVERFGASPETAETELRSVFGRMRRLGRNPENGAVAAMGVCRDRVLVAIFQSDSCLTVLTWPLFEPRMAEFGRNRLPRRRGRMLRRLIEPIPDEQAD